MKRNKVVRGKPIYLYRNRQYLEMPDKCVIKYVRYDEQSNRSVVYCKKPTKTVEIILAIIILMCVSANLFWVRGMSYTVRYNSLAVYYGGELFVNVYNDKSNASSVDIKLLSNDTPVYECTLLPGEYLISIPIDDVSDSYDMMFSYKTLISNISKSVSITVLHRGG